MIYLFYTLCTFGGALCEDHTLPVPVSIELCEAKAQQEIAQRHDFSKWRLTSYQCLEEDRE